MNRANDQSGPTSCNVSFETLVRHALAPEQVIRTVDVCILTTDGRELVMPRHTEPAAAALMVLEKRGLELPPRPPPRVRGKEVTMD
jgi:hypothetical protein